jgi:hypothetical protein
MNSTRILKERGVGLIILIMVTAFLLAIGVLLVFVTGTGPEVAGNIRAQERAFNAAEAGFDAAWRFLNENIIGGSVMDFSALYRTTYDGQPGLDDPVSDFYFRKRTDQELVADVIKSHTIPTDALFVDEALENDPSLAYTVFIINNEAMFGVTPNDRDCLLVCIGRAGRDTFARIEVQIEIQN